MKKGKKENCAADNPCAHIPSYINSIIDYALSNCKSAEENVQQKDAETERTKENPSQGEEKGFDHNEKNRGTNNVVKVVLKITVAEDTPLFEEKIAFSDGTEKLLDCWEIFEIAKTINDDNEKTWSELTVTIEEGKGLTVSLL